MTEFIVFVNDKPFKYVASDICAATMHAARAFPGCVDIEIIPASVAKENNDCFLHELILMLIFMMLCLGALVAA